MQIALDQLKSSGDIPADADESSLELACDTLELLSELPSAHLRPSATCLWEVLLCTQARRLLGKVLRRSLKHGQSLAPDRDGSTSCYLASAALKLLENALASCSSLRSSYQEACELAYQLASPFMATIESLLDDSQCPTLMHAALMACRQVCELHPDGNPCIQQAMAAVLHTATEKRLLLTPDPVYGVLGVLVTDAATRFATQALCALRAGRQRLLHNDNAVRLAVEAIEREAPELSAARSPDAQHLQALCALAWHPAARPTTTTHLFPLLAAALHDPATSRCWVLSAFKALVGSIEDCGRAGIELSAAEHAALLRSLLVDAKLLDTMAGCMLAAEGCSERSACHSGRTRWLMGACALACLCCVSGVPAFGVACTAADTTLLVGALRRAAGQPAGRASTGSDADTPGRSAARRGAAMQQLMRGVLWRRTQQALLVLGLMPPAGAPRYPSMSQLAALMAALVLELFERRHRPPLLACLAAAPVLVSPVCATCSHMLVGWVGLVDRQVMAGLAAGQSAAASWAGVPRVPACRGCSAAFRALASAHGVGVRSDRHCARCGAVGAGLHRCASCQGVFYCRRECQGEDWREGGHNGACRRLRGVARAAALVVPPSDGAA